MVVWTGALAISEIDSYHIFGPTTVPIFGRVNKDCANDFNQCLVLLLSAVDGCNDLNAGAAVMCSGIYL